LKGENSSEKKLINALSSFTRNRHANGCANTENTISYNSKMSKSSSRQLLCSELKKLKAVFDTLDTDGSGSIGIQELADPFLALGIADNVLEVQTMIDRVDEDGSGEIEFKEFLRIVKGD
jgi:Ca2+-binding EF-hand superfamily protein